MFLASEDLYEVFITDIAVAMTEHSQNLQNDDVPDVEDFDDDASAFTTQTVDSLSVGENFEDPSDRGMKRPWKLPTRASKTG